MRIWDEISAACERDELVEGTIIGRVKGGLSVDIGVKAFLPGSPGRHPPGPQPRQVHRREAQVQGHQVQQEARQHRALAPRAAREGARGAEEGDPREAQGGRDPHRAWSRTSPSTAPSSTWAASTACCTSPTCSWGRINHPSRSCFNVGDEVRVMVLKFDPATRARLAGPQADPGGPVAPRRREVSRRAPRQGQGGQPHRLRRLHRDRAGRRRPGPHQRDELDQARQAPVARW